jgi:DNA-directed RNA polymerase omega subunit
MINHLNMEGFPMVEPTIDELLTKAESKYSLVCAAAKRARELVDGA